MECYLATIIGFAGSYAPRYWALCNGQTLAIQSNQALFSIFGTTYGGNGVSTFNLPDLRGRSAVCFGKSGNLQNYVIGQPMGTEGATISMAQMPVHAHVNGSVNINLAAVGTDGIDYTPDNGYPSQYTGAYAASPDSSMAPIAYTETIGYTGNGVTVDTRSPFVVINYIIALSGVYPSKN